MESKQKWIEWAQRKELVNEVGTKANKPRKQRKWKLGWESPKDVAKAQMNVRMEWAKDAQRNKVGRGCPKEMKWAKEAQDGMKINPAETLDNVNWIREKVCGRRKRHPTGTSQAVTLQKQQNGVAGTLVDPQTRSKER